MRFRDDELERAFRRDGFVRVPFLDAGQLRTLQRLWARYGPAEFEGIYSNIHDLPMPVNREIDRTITETVSPPPGHLDGGGVGGATFLAKGTGPSSAPTPHQDWNSVDESASLSLSIWCPLVDVDEQNGALQVIAGSHRLRPTIRSIDTPSLYLDFDDELEPHLTCVPVRAGQAVIYAHNLFHGSKANRTDAVRPAIAAGVLADGAANIHYRRVPPGADATGSADDEFEILAVDRDFYFGGVPEMKDGRLPDSVRTIGRVRVPGHRLERHEVLAEHSG
ncbi:MAG: phytanoyl-CoA dioxygenase family protein [Acidimicrobiales bacterium]